MTKNKLAFTLAELMVVIAIIGMLTAAAVTIFGGAQAEARDARRVSDLNTMSSALEAYYIKNRFYPQPAKRTSENVWGYVDEKAKATCSVKFKEEDGKLIDEIDYNNDIVKCGGNIELKRVPLSSLDCNFTYGDDLDNPETDNPTIDDSDYLSGYIYGDWKSYKDICESYFYDNEDNEDEDYYGKELFEVKYSNDEGDDSSPEVLIVGFKGTLTSLSGKNSIHHSKEEKIDALFNSYLKEHSYDPKYNSSKYKKYGLGYYPYAVFRDNIGANISQPKAKIGGTAYQIAATLEKQDEDGNFHPETLIVGNYKPVTSDYPASLIGDGGTKVIIDGQKFGERPGKVAKGKRPDKPDNDQGNTGIPYPVEEIE